MSSQLKATIEAHPSLGWIGSGLAWLLSWLSWLIEQSGHIAQIFGLGAAIFGFAAGYYTLRIQRAAWREKQRRARYFRRP